MRDIIRRDSNFGASCCCAMRKESLGCRESCSLSLSLSFSFSDTYTYTYSQCAAQDSSWRTRLNARLILLLWRNFNSQKFSFAYFLFTVPSTTLWSSSAFLSSCEICSTWNSKRERQENYYKEFKRKIDRERNWISVEGVDTKFNYHLWNIVRIFLIMHNF